MNCKIPFTKDIDFEKKVSEITSISLEHEIKVEDGLLKGNFIVSGDFKSHEVSVNKEAFSYILPFEIDLADNINPDTIEFMIEDFTYEIVDNSILRVNIDFNVIGSVNEIKEEVPLFQDASAMFLEKEEENRNQLEEPVLEKEEKIDEEYATYHIHVILDNENLDTICDMYHVSPSTLEAYNDLTNLRPKDKIIIPQEK